MEKNRTSDNERKQLPVLLHVTGWIILFILPQYLIVGESFWDTRATLIILFNTLVYGIIFYVNYLVLIPKLMHKRRGLYYFPIALIFMVVMQIASYNAFRPLFPPRDHDRKELTEAAKDEPHKGKVPGPKRMMVYNFYITSVLVTSFAVGLRYGEKSRKRDREMKELEKEKLNSELAMLKNQISPHFFFNTLNNIYSLIEVNTADAQTSVLNLSKMMRYLLYETEHGNVKLSREIEFMRHYIDLMKLRLHSRVRLDVDFPDTYNDVDIPPLLFITFIENAFKHSAGYQGNPFIKISLSTQGSTVIFNSENSISISSSPDAPKVESGIGLENIRKRLTLIFGENYTLEIDTQNTVYSVVLQVDTDKMLLV